MPKVLAAMSGGVDSSVAVARLVEEGYEVFGVTLRLWDSDEAPPEHHRCCITEDVNDARKVCHILGKPHYVLDFTRPFITWVVEPFINGYASGKTPNPCLACNQHIKFRLLLNRALALGADFIATGHYARIQKGNGHYRLLKAKDEKKDQSYFLYFLGQAELSRLQLPLGGLIKREVRKIAEEKGLPVAAKHDSQDLCFVPGGNLKAFLKERLECRRGKIIDLWGNTIGEHEGIALYTIGQRLPLNTLSKDERKRLYAVKIIPKENILVAGKEEDLLSYKLKAGQLNWVEGTSPFQEKQTLSLKARIRYSSPEREAALHPCGKDEVMVSFLEPQRAITPGQAVVFYQGEEVVGGGTILEESN